MRKSVILGVAAVGAFAATPAIAQEKIVAAHYGGVWGKAIETCLFDTFTKATGIGVTPEPSVSTATRAKLQQQKGNPAIDIAFIDGGISELALADGTVAVIDPKKVPNLANVESQGIYKRKDGTIYAVSNGFYAVGIAYNTKEVKTPPTSFFDLWNKEFEGKVTMPSPANAAGVPIFLHWNKLLGGNEGNFDPVVNKIKQLKTANFFDTSGAGEASFQSGEVIIGVHYATAAWGLADKGLPIAYVAPKEGPTSSDPRMHIVEGTKKKEAAEKFINHAVSKEAATCMSETLYLGPVVKGVTLSEKAKNRMPWGPKGSIKDLVTFDWDQVNAMRGTIVEAWNKRIAGK